MKIIIQILICCTVFGQLHAQQKALGKYLSGRENSTWQFFEQSERISASELAKNKTLLGLGTKDELKPISDKANKMGKHHYRYQQIYKGVPVEWAVYLMHEKNNHVSRANGSLVYGLKLSTTPTISEEAALQTALQYTDATLYAWEDEAHKQALKYTKRNLSATFCPSGELVIIDPQLTQQAANCRLAYKFDIYAIQPLSRRAVYVDAHSNEVIKTIEKIYHCTDVPTSGETNYSGTVNFTACYANGEHTLKSVDIGAVMQVFDARGQTNLPFYDTDGHFDMDAAAVDVHFATEKFYEYLLNTFGRSSVDGNGAPMLSKLVNGNNAYWDGEYMVYGLGDSINFGPWTSPDIVGHEITHALTSYTSALIYQDESGALNESFSDIFGEVIERYIRGSNDWITGADFTLPPENGLRNMANPNDPTMETQQPDTYLGNYYHLDPTDNGGVHTNSGIQNHWFYLLSEGGTGTNDNGHTYDIADIGMEKAFAIAYLNLTTLAPNANFDDARTASITVAQVLQNDGILTASDVEQVTAAWCAVGVGPGCQPNCRAIDSLALVALYSSTNGADWTNTWDLSQSMDGWYGIQLNENGCVTCIDMDGNFDCSDVFNNSGNNMSGSLVVEIGNLSNLVHLDLRGNTLSDSIPDEISNLSNLTYLSLGYNQFSGSIPPELAELNNLTKLNLTNNNLNGNIPTELGNLNNLIDLRLSANNFSSNIPRELGNLSNLTRLHLYHNQLDGIIPSELGNLYNLVYLFIDNNQLSGNIPPEFGNLTNLSSLRLHVNQLSGCYDSNLVNLCNQLQNQSISNGNNFDAPWEDFCSTGAGMCAPPCRQSDSLALVALYNSTDGANWTNSWNLSQPMDTWWGVTLDENGCVTVLFCYENELNGNIPPELGNLENLTYLHMSGNQLSGNIPPELGNLSNLTHLYLSGNQFSGNIPHELGNLNNLIELRLEYNQLSGNIPPELGKLNNLIELRLEYNQLSGSIPLELGNLNNLISLGLESNLLSGNIPPELGNLNNLTHLTFSLNQFTGNVLDIIVNLENLEYFLAVGNEFSGSIPQNINNLTQLRILYLDSNQFSGTLPAEFGDLINLQEFHIRGNNFSGVIPSSFANLINLTHLTFSSNQFTGNVLDIIANLPNLKNFHCSHNEFSGSIPHNINNLTQLEEISLAANQFSGNIPPELGNLNNLTHLTFSLNQFTGNVLDIIVNLQNLEIFWASHNQFSGTLPTEIGNLVNLEGFDVRGNNFSGVIPSSFASLINLTHLTFSSNQFTGNVLDIIANLPNLKNFHCSHNEFSGSIPHNISNLTQLEEISLAANQFSGTLPAELGDLNQLTQIALRDNQFEGCYPGSISFFCSFSTWSDNANISDGNNFDAPWEDFCNTDAGVCTGLVWPGDLNNDSIVNEIDPLYWGLAFGFEGYIRPNATTIFEGQPAPNWLQSIGDINSKHQDADGNGIIDGDDLDVVVQNYGESYGNLSYSYDTSSVTYILQQVAVNTEDGIKETTYELYIQANAPINTHGINGSVEFEHVPGRSIMLDTIGSALQPTHYVENHHISGGKITLDFALTRTNKVNQLIEGHIVSIIVADKDLQSGNLGGATTNNGKMMSATGVVTPVGGSTMYRSLYGVVPDLPISLAVNHTYCGVGGTAEVFASEGIPPYTYTWSTGATSSKINDLDIGKYSVTVSDANGLSNAVSETYKITSTVMVK